MKHLPEYAICGGIGLILGLLTIPQGNTSPAFQISYTLTAGIIWGAIAWVIWQGITWIKARHKKKLHT